MLSRSPVEMTVLDGRGEAWVGTALWLISKEDGIVGRGRFTGGAGDA